VELHRPCRLGDTGPVAAEVRAKLAVLGLMSPAEQLSDPATATYDEVCDRAVRHFQQQRGLTVDGLVGPETYRALEEARWRLGDRLLTHAVTHPLVGDDVAALQQRLLDMGFDPGRVDGIFGRRTAAALKEFQRNVGVIADGTCGPATFKALDRLAHTVVGGRPADLRESEQFYNAGPALTGKTVVLDPGHGSDARGVRAHGLAEADVVTDLAARVEGRLAATGVNAYLTRGPQGGLDDTARAKFANTARADLFLSLHVDANVSPRASGVATYYYGNTWLGRRSAVGERLAALVQEEVTARTDLLDCRTHEKTWDLLRLTRMPAVRVEVGYLTSPEDARRLGSPAFRDAVAEGLVVAIQRLYLPPDLSPDLSPECPAARTDERTDPDVGPRAEPALTG
jgi:N-acetylmuramoyl-L-alanine amidase